MDCEHNEIFEGECQECGEYVGPIDDYDIDFVEEKKERYHSLPTEIYDQIKKMESENEDMNCKIRNDRMGFFLKYYLACRDLGYCDFTIDGVKEILNKDVKNTKQQISKTIMTDAFKKYISFNLKDAKYSEENCLITIIHPSNYIEKVCEANDKSELKNKIKKYCDEIVFKHNQLLSHRPQVIAMSVFMLYLEEKEGKKVKKINKIENIQDKKIKDKKEYIKSLLEE